MSLRSAFRTLVIAVVVLGVLSGGAVVFGVVDEPSVVATESRFAGVNATTTLVATDVVVANPNPIGVSLDDATVTHTVSMNGIEMGAGSREGLTITGGNTTVGLTTAIDNRKVPTWWASHVANGERTRVVATARVRSSLLDRTTTVTESSVVETHITDAFNATEPRPVNASLPVVDDPVLVVQRTNATWGAVTDETTRLATAIVVANPNPVPYPLTRIDYAITMNGITVGNGTTARGGTIPADGRRTIRANLSIDNRKLDEWWVSHLDRSQRTDLRVDLTAVVERPGGGTIRLPLDDLGYATTVTTDILDAANQSGDRAPLESSQTRRSAVTDATRPSAAGARPGRS